MELVVLSGKGGTGKTTVAAAMAHLASREGRITMADADVDAANLGLVLSPRVRESHQFFGEGVAAIDPRSCTACGVCLEVCRFDALFPEGGAVRVDPIACEGCASCFHRCPSGAIRMEERLAGHWFVSDTRFGPLVHAHLLAGQENSGKLVTRVKERAREIVRETGGDTLIVDGPPGIGCPVIAACSGADLVLVVTEPTVAGTHDLERVLATAEHFRLPAVVLINKHDLNPGRSGGIEGFCQSHGVPVVGRLPYDDRVTVAMTEGLTVTERLGGTILDEMERVWAQCKAAASGLRQVRR